jgi:predicted phosphodiesterase
MRIAIISDIHSNLQALETVLEKADQSDIESIYCLGDIVGYGADPEQCLVLVSERAAVTVLGNHDLAVATQTGLDYLPSAGKEAAIHNRSKLSEDQLSFLADLPLVHAETAFTMVHASPENPERWQRINTYLSGSAQFSHFSTDVCFVGHTHSPATMSDSIGVSQVRKGHRFLINVGSVGQPRDGDSRASFGIFDTDSFDYELIRIEYDIEGARTRIKEEGLPQRLADRLLIGR